MTTEQTAEQQQQAELDKLAAQAQAEENAQTQGEWVPPEQSAGGAREMLSNMPNSELCKRLLNITFGLLASTRGDHWKVDPALLEEAGNEYGACLDAYAPDIKSAPWVSAVFVTGVLVIPPLLEEKRLSQQADKVDKAQQQDDKHAD